MCTMGTVYLVGAGPGDPKLITVRGLELIGCADVIIYDFLANRELLSSARKEAELIYVGKQASRHELPQGDINRLLLEKAREKQTVVRLKGGDPFMFGRGGEEVEYLADRGIPFEIVPGVTSAIAAPAYAGIPLTHRDHASAVAFITGHEDEKKTESTINWRHLATAVDTLVFFMGIKNLAEIARKLIDHGRDPDTPASVIQWGTLPQQQVVTGTLSNLAERTTRAGITPPGIILVGEVNRLRDRLQWFEKRPLFGKKIVVTRAPHQSLKLGSLLGAMGAEVIYAPTISLERIDPNEPLFRAIDSIESFDYIIFTSVNGVTAFGDTLFSRGKDGRSLHRATIIPIGEATAAALRELGIVPDLIPSRYTSEGIVELLRNHDLPGKEVLLPRAEEARDVIETYVEEKGGRCHVVPVYRTGLPEDRGTIPGAPDVITFTSSSTVRNFMHLYGKDSLDMNRVCIASIGPITSETLRREGLPVHIEAEKYDIEGLVEAITKYFGK